MILYDWYNHQILTLCALFDCLRRQKQLDDLLQDNGAGKHIVIRHCKLWQLSKRFEIVLW